jgi:hypothetical protein
MDNDGDLDLLVTNNNGPARLLINQSSANNRWIQLKLIGEKDNRDGIGAKVIVLSKNSKPLLGRVHTDGSYLSASDLRLHFGLGKNPKVEAVNVIWPNGYKEAWANLKIDTLTTLRQGSGKPETKTETKPR